MDHMRLMRAASEEAPDAALVFMASTPGTKRDGLDTAALPWRVDNYRLNPVVTWVHDFGGTRLPIGRGDVEVLNTPAGEFVRAAITFDRADPFAAEVERKYRDGFLHAVSVSWDDVDASGIPVRSGGRATAHELLEIAAVPVPGDPAALQDKRNTALRSMARELITALASADDEPDAELSLTEGQDAPDLSLTNDEVAELLADGTRVSGSRMADGSYEDLIEKLRVAAKDQRIIPGAEWLYPFSTMADSVVFCAMYDGEGNRYWMVGYSIDGDAVTFTTEPVEVVVNITATIAERGHADNAADAADDATEDEGTGDDLAAEMVAVFDPESDDSDAVRGRRYRALLPGYRRMGWTAPELLPAGELAALDGDVWRGMFVSGELERLERVGKEISAANLAGLRDALAQLEAGVGALKTMVKRVDSGSERAAADEPTAEDIARAILDSMTARIETNNKG